MDPWSRLECYTQPISEPHNGLVNPLCLSLSLVKGYFRLIYEIFIDNLSGQTYVFFHYTWESQQSRSLGSRTQVHG